MPGSKVTVPLHLQAKGFDAGSGIMGQILSFPMIMHGDCVEPHLIFAGEPLEMLLHDNKLLLITLFAFRMLHLGISKTFPTSLFAPDPS